MYRFDQQFFKKHQKLLLFIANNVFLRWMIGVSSIPKDIKNQRLKYTKILPGSLYTENKCFGFTTPKFGNSLAYSLSPFVYLENSRQWRFSPAGAAYLVFLALLAKKTFGLPIVFFGTTTNYYCSTTGDGAVRASNATWQTLHDATTGDAVASGSQEYTGYEHFAGYYNYRLFFPCDTSGLTSSAVISAAAFKAKGYSAHADCGGSNSFMAIVQSTQADPTSLVVGDYDAITGWGSYPITEAHDSDQRVTFSGMSTVAYSTFTFNATGRSWINKTGYTKLCMTSGWDINNSAYCTGASIYDQNQWNMGSATGAEPYIEVTYTNPPVVTTQSATFLTASSFVGNGNITATGVANPTRRGFCYKSGLVSVPTMGSFTTFTSTSSASSFTQSYTVNAGKNKMLLVAATTLNGTYAIASATWNGGAMAALTEYKEAPAGWRWFYLANPATGTHDVVVTFGEAGANRRIIIVELDNADQGTPNVDAQDNWTTGTTFATNYTTTVDNVLLLQAVGLNSDPNVSSWGTNQTERVNTEVTWGYPTAISSKSQASAGAGTMVVNTDADAYVNSAVIGIAAPTEPTIADSIFYEDGSFGTGAYTKYID